MPRTSLVWQLLSCSVPYRPGLYRTCVQRIRSHAFLTTPFICWQVASVMMWACALWGKLFWAYLSIYDESSRRLTARPSTSTKHKRMRRISLWICNRIMLADLIGCLLALLGFRKFRHLTHDAQIARRKELFIKLGPAVVSIMHLTLFMLSVCRPTLTYALSFLQANKTVFVRWNCSWRIFAEGTGDAGVRTCWWVVQCSCKT